MEEGIYNNRPYYKQKDDKGKAATFLFHNGDCGKGPIWMVGWTELGKCNAALRTIGDTATPPESGWQYYHRSEWRWDDRSLDLEWGGLEPCRRVEVAARGKAATVRQHEMGSYLPTGSWLDGRPVYRKEEGETRYLRMAEVKIGWRVTTTQEGTSSWLVSGRSTLSPGDPSAERSLEQEQEGWKYVDSDGEWQDSRGQITVTCH